MKILLKIFLYAALPLLLTACFESTEVKQVKGGVMQLCPNHTVDQMVNGFMGSPSWKSGKSNDGKVFVNVDGDITFHDKPVRATVQFIVEGERFSFGAFEMNGVPSANIIAIGLLGKMCESAQGNVAEKSVENKSEPVTAPATLAELRAQLPETPPAPTLPALSAAAEKAVQEGFVEIKNPTVQACTDAKIVAIHKEIGADAPINYEMYNEAAVNCGFNI